MAAGVQGKGSAGIVLVGPFAHRRPTCRCAAARHSPAFPVSASGDGNAEPSAFNGTLLYEKRDASGTYYRRNRYYDPATGRFTQEDPIGLAGGLNVYAYAGGDPANFHDPFGLNPWLLRLLLPLMQRWPTVTFIAASTRMAARLANASELADDALAATRRLGGPQQIGTRVYEVARHIGNLRVGQEKAVDAIGQAIDKFGQRGETITIAGTRYLLASPVGGSESVRNAIAVAKDGSVTRVVVEMGRRGWEVADELGLLRPIP